MNLFKEKQHIIYYDKLIYYYYALLLYIIIYTRYEYDVQTTTVYSQVFNSLSMIFYQVRYIVYRNTYSWCRAYNKSMVSLQFSCWLFVSVRCPNHRVIISIRRRTRTTRIIVVLTLESRQSNYKNVCTVCRLYTSYSR